MREPRRSALGLLHEIPGALAALDDLSLARAFSGHELATMRQLLERGVQAPVTSSAGRLFDGVAALIGLRQRASFEAQAAMELEYAAAAASTPAVSYDFDLAEAPDGEPGGEARRLIVDWRPIILGIIADLRAGVAAMVIALRFHESLAEAIVAVARRVGERDVLLTGGCFQNRLLTERAIERLREEGFRPHWHRHVPPNDGGVAVGQIVAATRPGWHSAPGERAEPETRHGSA